MGQFCRVAPFALLVVAVALAVPLPGAATTATVVVGITADAVTLDPPQVLSAMCWHVFPNTIETVLVGASLDVGTKILVLASLSFLGLGTQPPTPDRGTMLASGREFVTSAPYLATLPGLGIFFTVAMLNLLADGVSERLAGRFQTSWAT